MSKSIRRGILIAIAMLVSLPAFSQGAGGSASKQSVNVRKTSFYFAKDQGWWFEKMDNLEIMRLVFWAKGNPSAKIHIEGWADPSGDLAYNVNLSDNRALTAKRYLIKEGIAADRITFEGVGVDYSSDATKGRRAEIIAYLPGHYQPKRRNLVERSQRAPEPAPQTTKDVEPKPKKDGGINASATDSTPTQKPQAVAQEPTTQPSAGVTTSEPATQPSTAQPSTASATQPSATSAAEPIAQSEATATKAEEKSEKPEAEAVAEEEETIKDVWSIRTNLLYWLTGMANVGFEWNPAETKLGLVVNGGYAPLGHDDWKHSMGGWFIAPEIRYYMGETNQWFVGAQFLAGGYNYKLTDVGYQGSVIGGGVLGGYKMELNKRFSMDFTLGLGYGSFVYDSYYHDAGVNFYRKQDENKNTVMPIQAGVNLIWKIQ